MRLIIELKDSGNQYTSLSRTFDLSVDRPEKSASTDWGKGRHSGPSRSRSGLVGPAGLNYVAIRRHFDYSRLR
jgi:hypothetical protein